jgi:hypothetical protein
MTRAELKELILRKTVGTLAYRVTLEEFFALDWQDDGGTTLQRVGSFLAELRTECIGHGSGAGVYTFFRINKR